jgi:flagellar hook-associated protein 3 FlgL
MRVTQSMEQAQFLAGLNTLESNIAQTQNQVSSGLAFTTPAQNPTAAGSVDLYNQTLAQSQQYTSNANSAQTSLNTENNALTQIQSQLQSLRSLALEANSGTVSGQNLSAIATQAAQIQSSLLSLANTQDGNGNYIFSGFATQTQPFTATATGASYAGDQGQQQIQIAAGQTVAAGDNGNAVFNQIKTGNGTFTVTANANNTGTGVVGAATVTNAATYAGGSYTIQFTGPGAYNVVDSNNVGVASGTYTDGQAIAFAGVQVTLSGTPATGDSFSVAPSANQSLFTTVQNLVGAINGAASGSSGKNQLSNSIAGSLSNLDQALNQISDVQSGVGGRLNLITTQLSVATSQQTQLQASISSLQSLDYASAITTLDSENTTLSAALQSYSLTQGLTLFKYL